jgi:hypothetical protein
VNEADAVLQAKDLVCEPFGVRSSSSANTASINSWFSFARSGFAV